MSTYIDQRINQKRTHQWMMVSVISITSVALMSMYLTWRTPHRIDVHLKPNIRGNTVVEVIDGKSPVPRANVYGFAHYVWQKLNIWMKDGSKDYRNRIFELQSYVTPGCYAYLERDLNHKSKGRDDSGSELAERVRFMSEALGGGYSDARVVPEGNMSWKVYLDMQLTEWMRGLEVKNTVVRYTMRVVAYDIDNKLNPYQLALDCSELTEAERLLPVSGKANKSGSTPGFTPSSGATSSTLPSLLDVKPSAEVSKGVQP
jgi:integrating conjugative element protein (TIGR03746 family)